MKGNAMGGFEHQGRDHELDSVLSGEPVQGGEHQGDGFTLTPVVNRAYGEFSDKTDFHLKMSICQNQKPSQKSFRFDKLDKLQWCCRVLMETCLVPCQRT